MEKHSDPKFRYFIAWAKEYLIAIAIFIIFLAGLGIFVWFKSQTFFRDYAFVVLIPVVIAISTVTLSLFASGYVQIVGELARQSKESAGLGFISSINRKVLLNKQTEFPWTGQWLMPGGYFNRDKGDQDPKETTVRRVKELVGSPLCEFKAQVKIAYTNTSFQYEQEMIDNGHKPIPVHVYLMLKRDKNDIVETDVVENNYLRWFTLDEISTDVVPIPPHIKELLCFLLDAKPRSSSLKYWELDQEYNSYYLSKDE